MGSVAAIGMTVGAGFYITAAGGGVLALVILVLLRHVEERMDLKSDTTERSLPNRD